MILESIIVVILFSLSVWYLAKPWLMPQKPAVPDEGKRLRSDLVLKKEEVMATLSDLTLDRQMKKISEKEYRALFDSSVEEGAQILKKLDSLPRKEVK